MRWAGTEKILRSRRPQNTARVRELDARMPTRIRAHRVEAVEVECPACGALMRVSDMEFNDDAQYVNFYTHVQNVGSPKPPL